MRSFMITMGFVIVCVEATAYAAGNWQEDTFSEGRLVFAISKDGNPECASYDGKNCLWGKSIGEINFTKVKPLVCGAPSLKLWGVTGFEDPNHWCNLVLKKAQ